MLKFNAGAGKLLPVALELVATHFVHLNHGKLCLVLREIGLLQAK